MATITSTVATGVDDGNYDGTGTGYSNTGTFVAIADSSATVYDKVVFLRFTGINVPQGTTISSASVKLTATGGNVTPLPTVRIQAEAADNPVAPTSRADGLARTRTTALVDWSGITSLASGTYTTPDLKAVIQEVVNRPGWVSGNSIVVYMTDAVAGWSGTASQLAFATYNAAPASAAVLTLTTNTAAPVAQAGGNQTVQAGSTVTLDGSASTDADGPISSYSWTQTSGTAVTLAGTGATRTFTAPNVADTLVFTLTVTDAGGLTGTSTASITVLPVSSATFASYAGTVTATGFTPTGGTAQAVLSDSSDATYVTSSDNPAGVTVDGTLGPLAAPAAGVDFVVQVRMNKTGASTGTLTATLYEGATQRAQVTGVAIPDALSWVTVTFPSASLSAVTAGAWNSGLRLVLSASAS